MKRSCILISAIFLLACEGSQTGPPQFPYQLRMEIRCLPVRVTLHCSAVLERENVTNQATWSISEGNAATISAPAIVTPVARGEIEISATYGYHATPVLYLVDPHDPPVELGWLSGQVQEDNDSKEPIAHAIVEIVEGDYNQGKSARTDAFGRYWIKYVKIGVPFTAGAFKAGYEPSTRAFRVDRRSEDTADYSSRLDFRLKWKPPG
jgi:hypothetical protein